MEIRRTRISISRFNKILKKNHFKIEREDYYLINPNYEIKFNLKQRKLPAIMNIPHVRDFFTTACYCVVSKQ